MEGIVRSRESLAAFLARGGSANIKDEKGLGLLHYAAMYGTPEVIEDLITEHGLNPNEKTPKNREDRFSQKTPLYLAVYNENLENARALLENGGNVNTRFKYNDSLLSLGARIQNPEMIRLLLEAGAEVNQKDSLGLSALSQLTLADCGKRAGERGYYGQQREQMMRCFECAGILIAGGEDPNSVSNDGYRPIQHVVRNWEFVRFLVTKGADPEPLRSYFERLQLPMEQFEELKRLHAYSRRNPLLALRAHLLETMEGGRRRRRSGRKATRKAKGSVTSTRRQQKNRKQK